MIALRGIIRLLQRVQRLLLGLGQRHLQLMALAGQGDHFADAIRFVKN